VVYGLGVDLVDVARIGRMLGRLSPYGLSLLFAPAERRRAAAGDAPYAAGRFAAKEALLKALGIGLSRGARRLSEIETYEGAHGAPAVRASGVVGAELAARGVTRVHVSITHERGYAAAVVVLEG
jgi:holo-[acyl-carrier protein] synthase